jgi:hypothetical protein
MEVVRTSETSVNFKATTRLYIPKDSKLQFSQFTVSKSFYLRRINNVFPSIPTSVPLRFFNHKLCMHTLFPLSLLQQFLPVLSRGTHLKCSTGYVPSAHYLLVRAGNMNKYQGLSRTPERGGRWSSLGYRLEHSTHNDPHVASPLLQDRASLSVYCLHYCRGSIMIQATPLQLQSKKVAFVRQICHKFVQLSQLNVRGYDWLDV